jgi:hypothetical protein
MIRLQCLFFNALINRRKGKRIRTKNITKKKFRSLTDPGRHANDKFPKLINGTQKL